MRKSAILACLLLALALPCCELPPDVGTALSEPDPGLLDKRFSGMWYALGPSDYTWNETILKIVPRADGGGFDVIGLRTSPGASNSVQWIRAKAYASEIDGEIYYNVKRVAWLGNDYTAEDSNSFLILKPEIGPEASLLFLRSMSPLLLKNMAEAGRVSSRKVGRGGGADSYVIYDFSRDDLVRSIRDTARADLFPMITGPFYRMGPSSYTVAAMSSAGSSDTVAKFGTWEVECRAIDPSKDDHACGVHDEHRDVVMWFPQGQGPVLLGKDRCDTSGIIARVDNTAPIELTVKDESAPWFEPKTGRTPRIFFPFAISDVVERMHFGRVLRLEFRGCDSDETQRAEVPLDGFAAAFSTAKSLVYLPRGE